MISVAIIIGLAPVFGQGVPQALDEFEIQFEGINEFLIDVDNRITTANDRISVLESNAVFYVRTTLADDVDQQRPPEIQCDNGDEIVNLLRATPLNNSISNGTWWNPEDSNFYVNEDNGDVTFVLQVHQVDTKIRILCLDLTP